MKSSNYAKAKPHSCWLAFLLFTATLASASEPLPRAEILVGSHPILVEVANTPASRRLGLMHRASLPEDQGMLFVFDQDRAHCMWMRDTLIPLSVAFIDRAGLILTLADMSPRSDAIQCSHAPSRFALEANRGWFAKRGISVGARARYLDRVPEAK